MSLGFTELESRVYCELLKSSPATGYRLSQAIGKASANVYQALAVLEQKGAVVVDDGLTRQYRSVAPDDLLASLESRFTAHKRTAKTALDELYAPAPSDKIFQLRDTTQALTRARQMIEAAREIILFDLFPGPLNTLAPHLRAARARGVKVAGLVYSPTSLDDIYSVVGVDAARALEYWPGLQLTLVVDSREFIVALLSHDGTAVRHGFWSDSIYLSCLQHSGLACEIVVSADKKGDEAQSAAHSLLRLNPAGLRELVRDLAAPASHEDAA